MKSNESQLGDWASCCCSAQSTHCTAQVTVQPFEFSDLTQTAYWTRAIAVGFFSFKPSQLLPMCMVSQLAGIFHLELPLKIF